MKKFINEFKEFAVKGNVVDMAVGVIIGAAFKSIVDSLVANILMPLIGVLLGGKDFSGLSVTVGDASIGYGLLIQNIIDFIIIAFCLFVMIKIINGLKKPKEEPVIVPVKAEDILLLEEIRDLLKEKNN